MSFLQNSVSFAEALAVFRPSSLLRFALKTPKNRRLGDFLPANCQSSPFIVVFAAQSDAKTYKCNRLLEAAKLRFLEVVLSKLKF
jgi:hypothetical protein